MSLSWVKFGCKKAHPISKNINPRIVQRKSMIHEGADFFFMRVFIIGIPIFSRPPSHQIVRNIRAISISHKMSLLSYHSNDIYPSIPKIEKNQGIFIFFLIGEFVAKKLKIDLILPINLYNMNCITFLTILTYVLKEKRNSSHRLLSEDAWICHRRHEGPDRHTEGCTRYTGNRRVRYTHVYDKVWKIRRIHKGRRYGRIHRTPEIRMQSIVHWAILALAH